MGRKHDSRMIIAYKRKEVELVSIEENVAKQSSTAARPSFDFVLLSTRYLSLPLFRLSLSRQLRSIPKSWCAVLVHLPFYNGSSGNENKKRERRYRNVNLVLFLHVSIYIHIRNARIYVHKDGGSI